MTTILPGCDVFGGLDKITVCQAEDEFCSMKQFDVCIACMSLSRNFDRQWNSMSEDGQSPCTSWSSSQGALARSYCLVFYCKGPLWPDYIARNCSGCHARRRFQVQLWRHEMCSRLCQQAGLLVAEKLLRFLILWGTVRHRETLWEVTSPCCVSHGHRVAIAKAWIRQWNPDASQSDIQMKSLRLSS